MGLECEYNDTLQKKTVSILDTQSQWPPLAILMIDCRSLRAVNQDIQMEQMFRTPIFLGGGNCLKLIWKYDSTQVRHLTVFAFELNLLCFMDRNMILGLSIFFSFGASHSPAFDRISTGEHLVWATSFIFEKLSVISIDDWQTQSFGRISTRTDLNRLTVKFSSVHVIIQNHWFISSRSAVQTELKLQ